MPSFIPKDDEDQNKFMGKSDILMLLSFAFIGIGGYLYYQHIQKQTLEAFEAAQIQFDAKDYENALVSYTDMESELIYKTDSLDSLMYDRSSFILDIKANQKEVFLIIDSLNQKALPLEAKKWTEKLQGEYFLKKGQLELIETVKLATDSTVAIAE